MICDTGVTPRRVLRQVLKRSLRNLEVESLDLVQLDCPPTEVYYRPEVFAILYVAIQDCGDIRGGLEGRARQSKLLRITSGG